MNPRNVTLLSYSPSGVGLLLYYLLSRVILSILSFGTVLARVTSVIQGSNCNGFPLAILVYPGNFNKSLPSHLPIFVSSPCCRRPPPRHVLAFFFSSHGRTPNTKNIYSYRCTRVSTVAKVPTLILLVWYSICTGSSRIYIV